jgi:hypothetical protein
MHGLLEQLSSKEKDKARINSNQAPPMGVREGDRQMQREGQGQMSRGWSEVLRRQGRVVTHGGWEESDEPARRPQSGHRPTSVVSLGNLENAPSPAPCRPTEPETPE